MKKYIFLILVLIFLAFPVVAGMSSNEAARFVGDQHYYLYENETVEEPIVQIKDGDNGYWVVPIISGEIPSTFFALNSSSGELQDNRATNSKLFRSADLLREYLSDKKKAGSNSQFNWSITLGNARIFDSLSRFLADEQFELNTIDIAMDDSGISLDIAGLNSKLASMSEKCAKISAGINTALAFETQFTTDPDTSEYNSLKNEFNSPLDLIIDLDDEAIEYVSAIGQLKQQISVSDLEADQKSYLIDLASPPENFNEIGNYALDATQLSQTLESLYSRVSSRNDSLLDEFNTRIAKDAAFNAINLDNERLVENTDGDIRNLKGAVQVILSEDNKPYWKNRSKLQKFEEEWRNTETYYKNGKYDLAQSSADKAITHAISVYKDGFHDSDQDPIITLETVLPIIVGLAILLIIIFAYRNRGSIMGTLQSKDEEVEIPGWEKP